MLLLYAQLLVALAGCTSQQKDAKAEREREREIKYRHSGLEYTTQVLGARDSMPVTPAVNKSCRR